ncbi:MAG: insulinase family protein [Acidobacteriota bacterium]
MSAILGKRDRPPLPEEPRTFRFPEFQTQTFGNGLRLYSCAQDRGPLVQISFVMSGGAVRDTADHAGRTTLAASLLDEGTSQHTSIELATTIEVLGGYLATQADWDSMSASVGVLSSNLESGFELLSEVVTDAIMPPAEVERLRAQRLAEIQRRQARPGVLANDALAALIYGDGSYGLPLLGTLETIREITRSQLGECLRSHTSPDVTAIIAV